jgi:hypothetical protein
LRDAFAGNIKLRDDIGDALSRKAGHLQSQLATLIDGGWTTSVVKTSCKQDAGPKGCPKYRNKNVRDMSWAWRDAEVDGIRIVRRRLGRQELLAHRFSVKLGRVAWRT